MDQDLIRLLRAEEIECRIAVINEKGLSLLLYKDARVTSVSLMRLLELSVGKGAINVLTGISTVRWRFLTGNPVNGCRNRMLVLPGIQRKRSPRHRTALKEPALTGKLAGN